MRYAAVDHILANFNRYGSTVLATHSVATKEDYVAKMKSDGVMGDHEELLALCEFYQVSATVFVGENLEEFHQINSQCCDNFVLLLHLQNRHYNLLQLPACQEDWVLIRMNGDVVPGQVAEINENGSIVVDTFRESGLFWVIGQSTTIPLVNVIRKVVKPVELGSRGRFVFRFCAELHHE